MSELEEKLSSLLSNPQLMQQIASMAQAMGGFSQESPPEPAPAPQPPPPVLDPKLMQFIASAGIQSGIDGNQHALLQALSPYLSGSRVQKLERAMRAAKMAGAASVFLSNGGLQLLSGR